ncbi:hypothetical protein [Sulfobacillus thermosulfidooxidans]|uniref:hypothetical protein n=1 Tax=Sulfobacillus thermosulfidooxidans TaxID=28034 RepID=UPI0006B53D8D|nr:hypothetical protein [Sulfobacillus thermosulfidooxidans]
MRFPTEVDPAIRDAIWAAETGRCEACGRPMDRRVARVIPRGRNEGLDPATAVLLCPLCLHHQRPPFQEAVIDADTLRHIAEARQISHEEAAGWLRAQLDDAAVLLAVFRDRLDCWLPGIGRFQVRARSQGVPEIRLKACQADTTWQVSAPPPIHRRGFPRVPRVRNRVWGFPSSHPSPAQTLPKEVVTMPPIAVRTLKVTLTMAPDQWPRDVALSGDHVIVPVTTPEGLTVQVPLKTKSIRKALKTVAAIRAEGDEALFLIQGRLLPGMQLTEAGLSVQRKSHLPPG